MQTSEKIIEISKALAKFQAGAAPVEKDGTNPHFRNRYATLDALIEAIRPQMEAAGLALIQCPETAPGGVAVTTRIMHTSGEWIESTVTMPVPQQTAQAVGGAITYGRRYALSAMLGLSTEDDDDGNAASQKPTQPAKPAAKPAEKFPDAKPAAPKPIVPSKQPATPTNAVYAEAIETLQGFQKRFPEITDKKIAAIVEQVAGKPARLAELSAQNVRLVVARVAKMAVDKKPPEDITAGTGFDATNPIAPPKML